MNQYGAARRPFFFLIDFEAMQPVVTPFDSLDDTLRFNLNGVKHRDNTDCLSPEHLPQVKFNKTPVDFSTYRRAFDKVKSNLDYGNSYLLNLTFPTKVETNVRLEQIYQMSSAKYKILYGDQFVCFSPETFITIHNGVMASYPMKGTINADIKDAEKQIMADIKEKAEHATIVDLIRNDMSIFASDVTVEHFRYIDRLKTNYKNLLQVSSKITGQLTNDYSMIIGDIIHSMLPAGSISGAPKQKTVEIIQDAEIYKRGYYTGVCGYFDGHNLDSCVMIRYMEASGNQFVFKSGGGITTFSDVQKEYQEMIDKVYLPI